MVLSRKIQATDLLIGHNTINGVAFIRAIQSKGENVRNVFHLYMLEQARTIQSFHQIY